LYRRRRSPRKPQANVARLAGAGVPSRAARYVHPGDFATLGRRFAQQESRAGRRTTFMRWCISTISISQSGEVLAPFDQRPQLTPRLILPERNDGAMARRRFELFQILSLMPSCQ